MMRGDVQEGIATLEGVLEPVQPVMARDGRNFDLGSKARSMPWLFPSVVAGCLRSLVGRQSAAPVASTVLQDIEVVAPFLVVLSNELGEAERVLIPAPVDAFPVPDRHPAAPRKRSDDEQRFLRLPFTASPDDPAPSMMQRWKRRILFWHRKTADVAQTMPESAEFSTLDVGDTRSMKPAEGLQFWSLDSVMAWLLTTAGGAVDIPIRSSAQRGLAAVTRVHASIRNDQVFQTVGLDFTDDQRRPLGIACRVRGRNSLVELLREGVPTTIAGERRAAWWSTTLSAPLLRARPEWIAQFRDYCRGHDPLRLRMMLVTPAEFSDGMVPGWAMNGGVVPGTSLRLKLEGIANGRWHGVSGWDMATHSPRPGRRLVPAGSIYQFRVVDGVPDLEQLWMRAVSDSDQARRDGFGITLWGSA